ncbi:MAG TPA: two-component regulator propeller domain-containing protein [Bacteroidia bacterium]|nr:two-component regulator propeller domain-containing protein [Bacteroidia bacterium]
MRFLFFFNLLTAIIIYSCSDGSGSPGKAEKEKTFSPPAIIPAGEPSEAPFAPPVQTAAGDPVVRPAGFFIPMQSYNTEEGLALSSVRSGCADHLGNLWFGTDGGGVSRFDGKKFSTFTVSCGLPSNIIMCIREDRSGNMWFGTYGGGVCCYDGTCFRTYNQKSGLAGNIVYSILEDRKGNLWFGTESGGVSRLDPSSANGKSFTNFTTADGLAGNSVWSMMQDRKGRIWFGTGGNGISCYDPDGGKGKLFTNYSAADGLAGNTVYSMLEDHSGNLWFGTRGNGVSCYDGNHFINYSTANGLSSNSVYSLHEDKTGRIWMGTYGGGVDRFDPRAQEGKAFTIYNIAQGLSGDIVWSILEDKSGNLWFGTYGGGVCRYEGNTVSTYTTEQGLSSNIVLGLLQDRSGNFWFGTEGGGVSLYDGKNFYIYSGAQGLSASSIWYILEDHTGKLWFCTSGGGVCCFDKERKTFSTYTTAQGLASNFIRSAMEDRDGNLWFGTDGNGVCCLHPDAKNGRSFATYTTAQGLANNTVRCMHEDRNGNIWFGTAGGGVSCLRTDGRGGKTFVNYSILQGLAGNTVLSILEDSCGNLWFGTSGEGVCRFNPAEKSEKKFMIISTAEGMADNSIWSMQMNHEGTIWFGTNLGFSGLTGFREKSSGKIVPSSCAISNAELAEKYIPVFDVFNQKTGYPVKDANTNALICDNAGVMWEGTGDKLVRFDHTQVHRDFLPPEVLLQAVKIKDENICWYDLSDKNPPVYDSLVSSPAFTEEAVTTGQALPPAVRDSMRSRFAGVRFDSISRFCYLPQHLVLPHEHNSITFDFTAIAPARPFLVRYRYFLDGYDKTWSPPTDMTTATFGNIFEGTYTFNVQAQYIGGTWSAPVTYTFTVLPPWYRTWWSYLSAFLLFTGGLWLFIRWRERSLKREKDILEEKVEVRTQQLREQKQIVEVKQQEILDSLNYARRIQYTLLAHDDLLNANLPEHFILFRPKDIVSGDFYWATVSGSGDDRRFYLAVCDCTGHGVPGAFMSLLNISFLNEAITEKNITGPDKILGYVRERLLGSVSKDGAQDGMDGILLCIEKNGITYAAAHNAPVIVRNGELTEFPADKMPVGKGELNNPFTLHRVDVQKGDMLFLYTDGFADQFGGPKGKKIKYRKLHSILSGNAALSLKLQAEKLEKEFDDWKGTLEQVDDVCVIGVRF